MDIAILRTAAADASQPQYTKLEYAALLRGARAVTYACLSDHPQAAETTFRDLPQRPLSAVVQMPNVDLLAVPTPASPELREFLMRSGWPARRLAFFGDDRSGALAQFAQGRYLVHRESALRESGLHQQRHAFEVQGVGIEDIPPAHPREARLAITSRVLEACLRARATAPAEGPYVVGQNWGRFLQATRPRFYEALSSADVEAMEALLANCFRNELTSGILGGRPAYDAFAAAGAGCAEGLRQHFNVWRHSVSHVDVHRLGFPPVGNPYGVWLDCVLVHANTMLNDHRASVVRDLVGHVDHPIVAEIGGGYGGFGRQWLMLDAPGTYVDFDLPENLIVASHFLASAHPDKRILLFDEPSMRLDLEVLRQYDLVLMPHFMLPRLAEASVDVFMNFISLSEMSASTIHEYLAQIERVTRGYFYQENLLDNGEGYEFYPVSVFPPMPQFRKLFSTPSRWPFFSASSPAHSHVEQLSIRADLEVERYLTAAANSLPSRSAEETFA
ncbi:putative sugar O-methyltransferase [Luteitalea sp.]|uniref:putative sugar O-methyltransferase n=1 Tax=Luteitalea sp. TaxID=2004800 RepID=UPI0025BCAF6C|nr:putative sugar O-methyltransferase [Luteitalea sp.]